MSSAKFGEVLICDAGPLIVLGRIGRLPLLTQLEVDLVIP